MNIPEAMAPRAAESAGRIDSVLRRTADFSVDALLLLDMRNIRYLTGFSGSDGALLIEPDRQVLLVDGRYTTQAAEETAGIEVREYRDKIEGIAGALARGRPLTVGIEGAAMTVETYLKLGDRTDGVRLQALPESFQSLRAVKTAGEIEKIGTAAAIAARALESVLARLHRGMRERDIAAELDHAMIRGGAEAVAFPTIVASGRNAALPHARPGSREIGEGDVLLIDCGAVCEGYHCDETCTFFVGRADDRQRETYQAVLEAHDRALRALRPGAACRDIDGTARGFLEERGLSAAFSHGTGHGVGLDVHEFPRIAAASEQTLGAGMVVTVEPGVYFPGLWGIRIEDLALVGLEGPVILTKTPKELTILDI